MEEIKKIYIQEKNYPQLLKKIKNPPKILYFLGKMVPKENAFGVVGTRKCSDYGKRVTFEITADLAEAGLTIVSGFAPGIDTLAHLATIERKKRTIAVLGTGLDEKSIYPKSNLKLVKKILENDGCLLSEYPPRTRGTKFTFPQRNRLIAGLSWGVLVVEAKEKSGALITANWAKKEKRKVFAIPGSIYSSNSKGPNWLIKNGSFLVEKADDILKELKIVSFSSSKIIFGKNEEENLILNALKEQSLHIDKIIEKTKLSPQKVASILSVLEIENKIRNLGGDIFALKP